MGFWLLYYQGFSAGFGGALPRVRVDAVRLRQVLVNLGGNAVKFTDRGNVTLRVTSLGSAVGSIGLRLEVIDTGVGIEPMNQAKIFEEFTQEDASTTRRFPMHGTVATSTSAPPCLSARLMGWIFRGS